MGWACYTMLDRNEGIVVASGRHKQALTELAKPNEAGDTHYASRDTICLKRPMCVSPGAQPPSR